MHEKDTSQVSEIDRESFPTQLPPANYQRELQNQLAHYIVACDGGETAASSDAEALPRKALYRLASRARRLFNRHFSSHGLPPLDKEYIIGFAGIWIMADEAHITNIAVRELYRHRGIGEALLISVIDLSVKLNARIVTLEVRASNIGAQNLYRKYGFVQVGLRRGYYIENKEDAVLMSTENIASASFQAHLQQLRQAHSGKWG